MPKKRILQKIIIPDAPLKRGTKGMAVINLQRVLQSILKTKGKANPLNIEPGIYGPVTEMMVRHFQGTYGLFPCGTYTELTRLRIKEVLDGSHDKHME